MVSLGGNATYKSPEDYERKEAGYYLEDLAVKDMTPLDRLNQ